jgi:5-methylcytosine-specific restriction endonuclease McrA
MEILKRPTLVLNRNWVPITTVTVQDALTMLFGGYVDTKGKRMPKARVLDVETWQDHGWDTWKSLPVQEGEASIRSSHDRHRVPEIIIVARYQLIPKNQLNFNRRNLMRRDECCQYCSGHGDTIDHILPRSKGGASTWTNCVISCYSCNQKKKDLTLEECGMTLIRQPRKPGLEILGQTHIKMKSWEIFFKGKSNE